MSDLGKLPSIDELARSLQHLQLPHVLVVSQARLVVEQARSCLQSGAALEFDIATELRRRLEELTRPSIRPVINATGVILHTNLGRASLAAFKPTTSYSNLEYDLHTGKRGKRDVHTEALLQALLGRKAIVVNNNASAVFLVLHELAAGHEVIVSRGELIEIGDGFRIPEIMARSGAILREVGTTNRTRLSDYADAVSDRTRLILRVHPSNFHVTGFAARPELSELCQLGRERKIPVYEDLGSGCLIDLKQFGVTEPLVSDSFAAGANLISFSCDKLLGGPQSGIIAGDVDLLASVRRNPMYRAFRIDKLVIEALQQTLIHLTTQNWQAVPTLRMICQGPETLRSRAERVAQCFEAATIRESESVIGGGSTPDQTLPTWVVELRPENPAHFERALRRAATPVIARIEKGRVLLDMRTVSDHEVDSLIQVLSSLAE